MLKADHSSKVVRLRGLLSQAAKLAEALDGGTATEVSSAAAAKDVDSIVDDQAVLAFAKNLFAFRRRRSEFFGDMLFADPAWDILLELYIMRMAKKPVRVKNACLASGVPATTALRWIGLLQEQGLIERAADTLDHRVRWVSLTDNAFQTMHQLLSGQVRAPSADSEAGLSPFKNRAIAGAQR